MNYPLQIVGFVIDIHNLTMYKADGDTLTVPQGDPRIKELVAKLVDAKTQCDNLGVAFSYMLQSEDMNDKNYFAEAEKQTNGLVRFFRMAKSKVKALVEKFVEPIGFMEVGAKKEQVMEHSVTGSKAAEAIAEVMDQAVPVATVVVEEVQPTPIYPEEDARPLTKSQAAVEEIMAGAIHSSSPNFNNTQGETEETATTIVAVLNDGTVIPGAEALSEQAAAVAQGAGSGNGLANFMRRAGMIKRGHSVEDLLKFVQKGELPLADDGCVLVYKLLRKTNEEGVFVDCHSRKVKQRVGSFVHMDEQLVDPNRSKDCSNGLHVARRDYLGSFGGDVCVLAKLAPEDVIAVPQYDARKLRAKGYHIIAELSDGDRRRVCNNEPMEDQVLLGNAIAGIHAEIIEYVKITEQYGGGLVVTTVDSAQPGMPALDQSLAGKSLDHLENKDEHDPEDCQVDARELALKVSDTAAKAGIDVVAKADIGLGKLPEPVETVSESPATPAPQPVKVQQAKPVDLLVQKYLDPEITELDRYHAAKALIDYKKKCKKSWTALDVPIAVWEKATNMVDAHMTPPAKTETEHLLSTPANAKRLSESAAQVKKGEVVDKSFPVSPPKAKTFKAPAKPAAPKTPATKEPKMTQVEAMAKLVEIYNRNPDKQNAKEIVAFKQKAKKSWDVLGVTDAKFIKKITERAKL